MEAGAGKPNRGRVLAPAGMKEAWRIFCRPGTNLIEHYACRGTGLIGATNLSPFTELVAGTGAVSRHKLDRRQKIVMVHKFYCGQLRESGCWIDYWSR